MNDEWPYGVLFVGARGLGADGSFESLLYQAWRNAWCILEEAHGVLGGCTARDLGWLILWEGTHDQDALEPNIATGLVAVAAERSLGLEPRIATGLVFDAGQEIGRVVGRLTLCNIEDSAGIAKANSLELARAKDTFSARWITPEPRSIGLLRAAANKCLARGHGLGEYSRMAESRRGSVVQTTDATEKVSALAKRFTLTDTEMAGLSDLLGTVDDQQIPDPKGFVDEVNRILMGAKVRIFTPDGTPWLLRVQTRNDHRSPRSYIRLSAGNGKMGGRVGKIDLEIRRIARRNSSPSIELAE